MRVARYMQQEPARRIDGPDDFTDDLLADLAILEQQIAQAPSAPSFDPAVRPGYLYAVQFSSNTVKVGRSGQPKDRIAAHARAAEAHAEKITSAWTSRPHMHCDQTERQLIKFCHGHGEAVRPRSRGEYFRGVPFATIQQFAELLVEQAIESALLDQRRLDDAERREYLDGLIDAAGDDLSWTWQQAHEAWDAGNYDAATEDYPPPPEEGD